MGRPPNVRSAPYLALVADPSVSAEAMDTADDAAEAGAMSRANSAPRASRPERASAEVPRAAARERTPRDERAPSFDDHELVRAVREGDTAAAFAFHDRLRPTVERTVRRLLGRGDVDEEDLVQIAMVGLVASMDGYRADCSLTSWASTIAAHAVYKEIRRRRVDRRVFDRVTDPTGDEGPAPLSAARAMLAKDLVTRVRARLESIDHEKAWTFLLHDVCGFDLREIARITSVSVAAAQTRLVRGRRAIHASIAADPELATALLDLEEGR